MIIQILSLDMRKALKTALIPPGPDFCTQLHHAHIAVVSYEFFFVEILGYPGATQKKVLEFFFTFQGNEK